MTSFLYDIYLLMCDGALFKYMILFLFSRCSCVFDKVAAYRADIGRPYAASDITISI